MARADRSTITSKTIEYYADFMINFDRNPVTGLLARAINEDAIKNALRNLILTGLTERPYQPSVGSKISTLLFDPMDAVTESLIKDSITVAINNHEPRVILRGVDVVGDDNRNEYMVSIVFSLINIPNTPISMAVVLKRVR